MTSPSFDDPSLAAQLEEWRATDDAVGAFATNVSQRARIVELESEVDRLVERWQQTEVKVHDLQRRHDERDAADEAARHGLGARLPGLRR